MLVCCFHCHLGRPRTTMSRKTTRRPVRCDRPHPPIPGHRVSGYERGIENPTASGDGAAPDPHIVELGKLMLARAPKLGKAMADLLCREIDAYRDGTVVTKDRSRRKLRGECDVHLRLARRGRGDVDVSPAEHTGTARALAGVPLPAVMTAYRIGFRFMWEQTLATARAAAIPTDSILDATARVFIAQDTFTQAMSSRLSPTADRADPRAGGRAIGVGGSAAVPPDHRQPKPLGGGRPAAATHLGTVCRRGSGAAGDREAGITHDRKQALRPRHPVGVAAAAGLAGRHRPSAGPATPAALGTLVEVLRQAATARVGISPPFHELAETSDALRFARLAVTGKPLADSLVTVFDDTPLAVAAVSAPEVMAKIRSSVLGPLTRCRPRNARCCSIPSGLGCRRAAPPTTPRRRSIATPTPCGTACTASRS